jgi:hypothetical protein
LVTATQETTDGAALDATKETADQSAESSTQEQQTDQTKTEEEAAKGDETKVEGEEDKAKKEEPEGAPEAYEDFTVPEGVELDATVAEDLKGLAKELNLPQAKAQQIADLGVKMAEKWAADHTALVEKTSEEWVAASKADPEFGGPKLQASLASAAKAIDTFGTPEFRALLNTSKLGNHPEFVRFVSRVGNATTEDSKLVTGGGTTVQSAEDKFYPTMATKK